MFILFIQKKKLKLILKKALRLFPCLVCLILAVSSIAERGK
jgi:hypothetical protein